MKPLQSNNFIGNQVPAFYLNGEIIDNALKAFLQPNKREKVPPIIYCAIVMPDNKSTHEKATIYHFNTAPGMGCENGKDMLEAWARHGPKGDLPDLSKLDSTPDPKPLFQVCSRSITLFVMQRYGN